MISTFLQLQVDSLAQNIPTANTANPALTNEVSVLEFLFKGGLFLIPIAILLFYTLYLIFERYMYIQKAAKIDNHLMADIRNHLNNANIELARARLLPPMDLVFQTGFSGLAIGNDHIARACQADLERPLDTGGHDVPGPGKNDVEGAVDGLGADIS